MGRTGMQMEVDEDDSALDDKTYSVPASVRTFLNTLPTMNVDVQLDLADHDTAAAVADFVRDDLELGEEKNVDLAAENYFEDMGPESAAGITRGDEQHRAWKASRRPVPGQKAPQERSRFQQHIRLT